MWTQKRLTAEASGVVFEVLPRIVTRLLLGIAEHCVRLSALLEQLLLLLLLLLGVARVSV